MTAAQPPQAGPGRPRGRQHDATVHVRLPRAVLRILRQLARESHTTVTAVVRLSILAALKARIEPVAAVAKDRTASAGERLAALRTLQLVGWAVARLGPAGLKLARAEAAALGL